MPSINEQDGSQTKNDQKQPQCYVTNRTGLELKHQNSATDPDLETVTAAEDTAVPKLLSRLEPDKSPRLTWMTNTAL